MPYQYFYLERFEAELPGFWDGIINAFHYFNWIDKNALPLVGSPFNGVPAQYGNTEARKSAEHFVDLMNKPSHSEPPMFVERIFFIISTSVFGTKRLERIDWTKWHILTLLSGQPDERVSVTLANDAEGTWSPRWLANRGRAISTWYDRGLAADRRVFGSKPNRTRATADDAWDLCDETFWPKPESFFEKVAVHLLTAGGLVKGLEES